MKTACKHTNHKSEDWGYTGPVWTDPEEENRYAHGGICQVDTCLDCGAKCYTNMNGGSTETSGWQRQD